MPTYVADAGVKSLTDIGKYKDKFDGKIYGIEPGNDGNRIILDMIDEAGERPRRLRTGRSPRRPAC